MVRCLLLPIILILSASLAFASGPSPYGAALTPPPPVTIRSLAKLPRAQADSLVEPVRARGGREASILSSLRRQLGGDFNLARYGNLYFTSDMPEATFSGKAVTTLLLTRKALERDFFGDSLNRPVVIYAFRDMKSYTGHLKSLWNEAPISPYGHYNYIRRHIVFNCQTGLGTMVHELTHALMASDMPDAPIWFAEGLASLFEQCRVEGRSLRGVHNWRLPELKRKLDTLDYTPLAHLLRMDDSLFNEKESLHYGEARYFCMYLQENGVLRRFYSLYRAEFNRDRTGQRFIEEVFGLPLRRVEQDWKSWVRNLNPAEKVDLASRGGHKPKS